MRTLLLMLALLVCTNTYGGEFLPESEDSTARVWEGKVKYIETDDVARVCGYLHVRDARHYLNARDCYRMVEGTCIIVVRRIQKEQDFITPGHEINHCVRGDFHFKTPDGKIVWHQQLFN